MNEKNIIKKERLLIRDLEKFIVECRNKLRSNFFSPKTEIPKKERFSWILFFLLIKEFNELTRFLLSLDNKKYVAFPLRTCLEILWKLEKFLQQDKKSEFFEFYEKKQYKYYMNADYPISVKSTFSKINYHDISQNSRLNKYDIYRMLCGITHANSCAIRFVSRNRKSYYSFFLYHMIIFQLSILDILVEFEHKFLKSRLLPEKEIKNFINQTNSVETEYFEFLKNKIER